MIPVDTGTSFDVIQPTILKHSPARYQILCRSKQNVIITSFSDDTGLIWTELDSIPLPNPNSGIDAVTLTDGTHLLTYNPLVSGKEWNDGRNRLNLAKSSDGIHWTDILVLEDREKGEFSYPAIIQSDSGKVFITYTFNRRNISFIELLY